MNIKLLISLLFGSLLIPLTTTAQDTLNNVRILDGIVQQRPQNTRQTIGKRYVWNFKGKSYTILMTIDIETYNSYDGKERYDIPKLVKEGIASIGNLTREFQNVFKRHSKWSKQERIDFVLSFVQSLPYTLDDVTTGYDEFRRYAIETLVDGGGDCEDTTILVAAILQGLGEKTALIFTPGHIALGVSGNFIGTSVTYNNAKYYYCETTGTGWTVGVLPTSSGTTVTNIIPLTASKIDPTPKLAPKITTPTPHTPTIKTTPETTKPEKRNKTESSSRLGTAIVIFFILIALGISTVYFLHRSYKESREYE